MSDVYAILMDIVRSRDLPDRAGAQRQIQEVLASAAQGLDLLSEPYATVGDEFQAVAPALPGALTFTERVQLMLPEGLGLRFGVGRGRVAVVGGGSAHAIQDGSAWWLAREAIERAHDLQGSGGGYLRTRYRAEGRDGVQEPVVNALLALRDHALAALSPRQRRMMVGLAAGRTQGAVAADVGVTQAAVSQFASSRGAALLAAHRLLVDAAAGEGR